MNMRIINKISFSGFGSLKGTMNINIEDLTTREIQVTFLINKIEVFYEYFVRLHYAKLISTSD